jgi:hypothetical protein
MEFRMIYLEKIVEALKAERERRAKGLAMLKDGTLTTTITNNVRAIDTTAQTLADYESAIRNIDEALAMAERDASRT